MAFAGSAAAQEVSAALKEADADYKAGQAALAAHDLNGARVYFEKVVKLAPQAEQGHSAFGAVLVSLGQTLAGIRELEKALAIKPGDESAQINLALAYEQSGSAAKALPFFAKLDAAARADKHSLPAYALAAYARCLAATQPELAIAKMRAAVTADPGNSELHDELGSLYVRRQAWPDAEQQFAEAARLNPALASAHLHLGLALQAQQKPGALAELSSASQLAPDDPTIGVEFGKALSASDQDAQAIAIYRHLLDLHRGSAQVEYQLALALQRTNNVEAALPLFEKVVTADPNNAEALTNLGLALTQVQRAKDAVPRLQQAVTLSPGMVTAHQNLAGAYIQLNQIADAIIQLRIALKLAPESPQLHYNLGLAFKMQDDAGSAIPELEIAEKENPSAPEPPYVLGVLYMQSGRYADAAAELDRSLKLQPTNGDGWATLGSVDAKLEKLPEAAAALEEAIRQCPQQPDPHLTLATVLAKQGQTAEATAERKKAADLMRANSNRQRAEVATHSADSLVANGKFVDAVALFKEALSYDPDYPEAHRGLATALEKQGDAAAAAVELQKAADLENAAKP
ncbi:tetratricopeptide repeat protein [Acidisarcina polymorpha]|uniref:tetratricopeptide repeat protein n=1 Tax=Acidisarcina polymorpha TaxID=2211140 RepID=UPI001237AACE|nr:tetratricopeptide repeat protein [Acidisarcina polymorpha]